MSNVDFDNGFLCGLAVKGTNGCGGGNKGASPIIANLLFDIVSVNLQVVSYNPSTRGDEDGGNT